MQFNLANPGLLDEGIARSYGLIIRMFAGTIYFPEYWHKARHEFNESFVSYVDEQVEAVSCEEEKRQ